MLSYWYTWIDWMRCSVKEKYQDFGRESWTSFLQHLLVKWPLKDLAFHRTASNMIYIHIYIQIYLGYKFQLLLSQIDQFLFQLSLFHIKTKYTILQLYTTVVIVKETSQIFYFYLWVQFQLLSVQFQLLKWKDVPKSAPPLQSHPGIVSDIILNNPANWTVTSPLNFIQHLQLHTAPKLGTSQALKPTATSDGTPTSKSKIKAM